MHGEWAGRCHHHCRDPREGCSPGPLVSLAIGEQPGQQLERIPGGRMRQSEDCQEPMLVFGQHQSDSLGVAFTLRLTLTHSTEKNL